MATPRLRTAEGALEIIKAEDPETAVTLRHIRRLIATGTVPHVPVGRKKLVNVDGLLTYLEGGTKEAARGATNTTNGRAEKTLARPVSASYDT